MNHEQLIEEAKELAKGKKTAELAEMAFIYSYVANHELKMVWDRVNIILGIGTALLIGAIIQMLK